MHTTPIAPAPACHSACCPHVDPRAETLTRALRLEYFTLGWNLIEGVVAIVAALSAGSVAILGFGVDSFVECASALVMVWRLKAERSRTLKQLDAIERRARRFVAASLFLLAAYVSFDALRTLWAGERPTFTLVGLVLLVLSIGIMLWLARAKRKLALELGSEALEADAFQTTACWWLSIAALFGVGLNGALGWWWADPVAALVIAVLVAREGRDAWRGRACC